MRRKDETKTKRSKATKLIVLNTLFVIFGLASAFTGTAAWFQTRDTFDTTVGSFQVTALPGVEFNLYFLDHFTDSGTVDGNWNDTIDQYSGYVQDYSNSTFLPVEYDSNGTIITTNSHGKDPTSINHLWPAHKLTFAAVLTSGDFGKLSIDSWAEDGGSATPRPVVEDGGYVYLSWAIDIYGAAYHVNGADVDAALTAGFTLYRNASPTDVFCYKETYGESESAPTLPITVMDTVSSTGTYTVAFFTIEFSNAASTWYSYVENGTYYEQDSVHGNSNCYERLRLTQLSFVLG